MAATWLDGNAVLRDILASSPFRSAAQAVATLTQWSHPETVAQVGNRALFPIIRCREIKERGRDTVLPNGRVVMQDDNTGPTDAFLYANGLVRGSYRDVQFNHLWQNTQDVESYTCLANVCVTPSFLAKLTDTDAEIRTLLRYRAYQLYGYTPSGAVPYPEGFEKLRWADPLPPVTRLESAMRQAMHGKKGRTVECARRIGWLFSGFAPDPKAIHD